MLKNTPNQILLETIDQPIKKLKFNSKNKPGFYAEVRREVDNYFTQNSISKNANSAMLFKSAVFLISMVVLYLVIITETFGNWTNLGLAALLGMVQAFIGFNVSHDAIHGSYTKSKKWNTLIGYTFNIIGANAYVWDLTHNKVHHTFTNIPGHDEDLEVAPGLIRLSPMDENKAFMKYQHIYAFFLYGLTSLSWVFRKDFKKFFQKTVGETVVPDHPPKEYVILFLFKAIYYSLFIVLPLVLMDITWWQFIIGFLVMHLAEGVVLSSVFQLAHIVEDTAYPTPNQDWEMEESWAMVQMEGTANYSTDSAFMTFFTGGLNFQIEHHLFPLVCHIHYPKISKIVEKVAKKHDVPYHVNPTFFGALKSHYNMLKKFGKYSQVA